MTTNCALKPRGQRQNNLTITLLHERNDALCKVRAYRRDQEDDAMLEPGDELDAARSLAEIETHAGLIDQTEDRLKQIDDAFNRLERGLYGVCEDCGDAIPALRLKVLPFATRCVDCQGAHGQTHRGAGALLKPYVARWEAPPEMIESIESVYSDGIDREPQESLSARREQPEVREEAESEQLPIFAPARAR